MSSSQKKRKCRGCGGYCGRRKGQGCQYAANEAKRHSEELYQAVTAGLRNKKGGAA